MLKNLYFALLIIATATPAQAHPGLPKVLKIDDGTRVDCTHHIYREDPNLGAYRVEVFDFHGTNEEFTINFEFQNFACDLNSNNNERAMNVNELIGFYRGPVYSQYYVNEAHLIFYNNLHSEVFSRLFLGTNSRQELTLKFKAKDVLSAAELKRLQAGETIKTYINFYLQKDISIYRDHVFDRNWQLNYGSLRFELNLTTQNF